MSNITKSKSNFGPEDWGLSNSRPYRKMECLHVLNPDERVVWEVNLLSCGSLFEGYNRVLRTTNHNEKNNTEK